MNRDLLSLPTDLPVPKDDGACAHLAGTEIPNIVLTSTNAPQVNLRTISQQPTLFFFYPRTGRPEEPAPEDWDQIPGARGCTSQSCGYRNLYREFKDLGVEVYGISTQSTEFHQEFVHRTEMPFSFLSDEHFQLTNTLNLPTFEYNSMRLIKRIAIYANHGRIVKVFYPVFPPDQNASTVLHWLQEGIKERKVADLWNLMGKAEWDKAEAQLDKNCVCIWPQSKERFNNAKDFMDMNSAYPGKHQIDVKRLEISGNTVISQVHIISADPRQEVWATSFFDFDGPNIVKITEFWAPPDEAPEWRAKWVGLYDEKN